MLLLEEAEKLSLGTLEQGVIETIVTTDQLFEVMPFKAVDGKEYDYNRENTISEADFVDVGDTINEGGATFAPITARLKRLASQVEIDNFLQDTMSDTNDQTVIQVQKKIKGLGNKFRRSLITSTVASNAKSFDGILKLCPVGQQLDVNNAALSFEQLDWLINKVKMINGQRVFFMNSRTLMSFFTLCRSMPGNTVEMLQFEGVSGPLPSYRGIPILTNDYVPIDQVATSNTGSGYTACTTVTLATLNEDEGLCGMASKKRLGIVVEDIGIHPTKDAKITRVKWYVSVLLMSTLAIAQVIGIND